MTEISERDEHVSYGGLEEFYDEDRRTVRIVKKRFVTWRSGDGERMGRWDYVPAGTSEADATR